jgi:hypothetical protein
MMRRAIALCKVGNTLDKKGFINIDEYSDKVRCM